MAVTMYENYYVSAIDYQVGPSTGTPSYYQAWNARKIYNYFYYEIGDWTINAIAGMIGNMQLESYLNPACVYPRSAFPNGGNTLADISNVYALNQKTQAYGLVQWKGLSSSEPIANQIVSYCYRYGEEWYTGNMQLSRLYWEWSNEKKFHPMTIDGTYWTFHKYSSSTLDPARLAYIWMRCYEGTYSKVDERESNAEYWYTYFGGESPGPDPTPDPDPPTPPEPGPDPDPPDMYGWTTGESFANIAMSYNGRYIPYSEMDCVQFVNACWKDIGTTPGNLPMGTNTLWRSDKIYQTTEPVTGTTPVPVLYFKDTLAHGTMILDGMPTGCLLFHKISDAGPPAIPDQYAGDGIGNFAHVGIYCGNGVVMQSGGRDSASVPGGGVHMSSFDPKAWNYMAFVCYVSCYNSIYPIPTPIPDDKISPGLLQYFLGRRRKPCHRISIIH